jgi:ribose transport system permease protein
MPPESTSRTSLLRGLLGGALGPLLTLAIVVAGFGLAEYRIKTAQGRSPTFLTVHNVRTLTEQSLVVAVAALGMTMIIISGGIDLAAGTTLALCAVVTASCFRAGYPMPIPLLAAVGAGAAMGLLNGILITSLRIVPFVVTLGTMSIALGAAKGIANQTTVEATNVSAWMKGVASSGLSEPWLIYPVLPNFAVGVWLLAVLAVSLSLMLRYTVFGRYIFAVGSSESTARLCGINVAAVKIGVYAMAGMFVGLAGVLRCLPLSSGDPTGGGGYELKIIAAVVIGGASLNGGRGSVLGTIAGAATMGVIATGCNFLGIDNWIQDMVIGAVIIAAAAFDQFRRRKLAE